MLLPSPCGTAVWVSLPINIKSLGLHMQKKVGGNICPLFPWMFSVPLDCFPCSNCLCAIGIKKQLQKWKSGCLPQGRVRAGKAFWRELHPSDVYEQGPEGCWGPKQPSWEKGMGKKSCVVWHVTDGHVCLHPSQLVSGIPFDGNTSKAGSTPQSLDDLSAKLHLEPPLRACRAVSCCQICAGQWVSFAAQLPEAARPSNLYRDILAGMPARFVGVTLNLCSLQSPAREHSWHLWLSLGSSQRLK